MIFQVQPILETRLITVCVYGVIYWTKEAGFRCMFRKSGLKKSGRSARQSLIMKLKAEGMSIHHWSR